MDPEVLAFLIPAGVAVVIGLTAGLGWARPAALSAESAAARYLADHPELPREALEVELADDRRAALLWAGPGEPPGAVFALGDRAVTRRLSPASLRGVALAPGELVLYLRDFSRPVLRVALSDPAALARWRRRLTERP